MAVIYWRTSPRLPLLAANLCRLKPYLWLNCWPVLLMMLLEGTRSTGTHCSVSCSSEEPLHVPERLHHVHAVPGERRGQPRPHQGPPGHEPPSEPLLHLLVAQHLSDQGPGDQRQQHRAVHQVFTGQNPIRLDNLNLEDSVALVSFQGSEPGLPLCGAGLLGRG